MIKSLKIELNINVQSCPNNIPSPRVAVVGHEDADEGAGEEVRLLHGREQTE